MFNQIFVQSFCRPKRIAIHLKRYCQCWKCNESTTNLFCPKCNSLQKPNKTNNYFQVLGIEENYAINEIAMSKNFKNLQKLLHPDKFSNKTESEQEVSGEYSSLVNKAYSTLLNPLSRGTYMLNLKGIEISENTQLESKFLHEIMERNEEVENADTPEEILKIELENKKILKNLQTELADFLNNGKLTDSQNTVIRMKYYDSINNQIQSIISKMKIVK